MIEITIIPVLGEHKNYAYLLKAANGETAVVDPGDAAPVITEMSRQGLTKLDYILNTHHHWDHTDGNEILIRKYKAKIVAPASEKQRINNISIPLRAGDPFTFGGEDVQTIETPGHTAGHICFYFPESKMVFTGDTLFLMGCGRLFEGNAKTMHASLQKLAALPDDTKVYCGHEYTLDNGEFCLSVEPENQALKQRMEKVRALHAAGTPTVPGTIGEEKQTNAFLRAATVEDFAKFRKAKDAT